MDKHDHSEPTGQHIFGRVAIFQIVYKGHDCLLLLNKKSKLLDWKNNDTQQEYHTRAFIWGQSHPIQVWF